MTDSPVQAKRAWRWQGARLLGTAWQMFCLAWQAHPACFVGMVSCEAARSILSIGQAWIAKLLFDLLARGLQAQAQDNVWRELGFLLLGQIGITLFNLGLDTLSGYLRAELGRQVSLNVQSAVYGKLNSLAGMAPFESPAMYDTIQLGVQGAQTGLEQMFTILVSLLRSAITLVMFLGILLLFNPLLTALVVLSALPQLYLQLKMGRQRFGLAYDNSPKQRLIGYYSHLLSSADFAKELRLLNLGGYFLSAFQRLVKNVNQAQRAQQQRESLWQAGLSLLSNGVSSLAFVIVAIQAFRGFLTIGDVTLYTNAVAGIQGALAGIIYAFGSIHESTLFFSHYTSLMALPQPIFIPAKAQRLLPLQHHIELRGVSFRYSAEQPWVLKDISLRIPAGSCLALVGLNGSGKTTLVKLLTRMYDPTEGQILWDGVDIRQFDVVELRERMGAIFQDFVRFDLTAFENVALGNIDGFQNGDWALTAALVEQAAMKAGVHETIEKLPRGYQTVLSRWLTEEGQSIDLSGGEWQKIGLARLFVRQKADFLILDEPTAALDAQAEYDVYSRFIDLVNGRTSLLISHRFSTVKMADAIAVLENGRITEYGPHDALLALNKIYARLYNLQAERYR
jgi:ATP-binding cassette subfamily B protein